MATTAQVFANQENSKRSTGPRTPDGKAASSANAKTHGLSAADPVLPHENRDQYNELLKHYHSDFAPTTAHEEFLVSQMTGARWKLDRIARIEVAMFAALESPGDPATTEALMAQAFIEKDTGNGFARLDRYRASLERTYRCARELRAARQQQNEANSTEAAEKKFEKLLKKMLDAPPPGFEFRPKLVPIDQNGQQAAKGGANQIRWVDEADPVRQGQFIPTIFGAATRPQATPHSTVALFATEPLHSLKTYFTFHS